MAITQTISAIPSAGQRGVQTRDDFVLAQEAFQDALSGTTVAQLNAFATQANALETNVNNKEASATTSSLIAIGAANYKGDWVSGYQTTGYSIGFSVTYSGFNYVSKINNNLATPSGVTDANWLKVVIAAEDSTKVLKSGDSLSGALNTAKVSVASSATTSDIWTGGNIIDFTGTATVTAFPNAPQAGAERTLICAGACSFTAGANMLINGVTSGQTVTCAVGDKIEVIAVTTTQFRLNRVKADGTAQVSPAGGSMILLSTVNASAASTVDIEGFNTTYDDYIIIGELTASVADSLLVRWKFGGVYITDTTYLSNNINLGAPSSTLQNYLGANAIQGLDNSLEYTLFNINSIKTKKAMIKVGANTATPSIQHASYFHTNTANTSALQGVRFYGNGGATLTGTVRLYGIKKA